MRRYQCLNALGAIVFFCNAITLVRGQSNEIQRVVHMAEADSASLQFGKVDTLFLTGKVANPKHTNIKIFLSTYEIYKQYRDSIKLNSDGSFLGKIPVINRQSFYIYINNTPHQYYVNGGDTLDFSWDDHDPAATFKVHSPNPKKDTIIQIESAYFALRARTNAKLRAFMASIPRDAGGEYTLDDKSIFDTVNLYYNESVRSILAIEKKFTAKDLANLYHTFDHILVANYFESIKSYNYYFSSLSDRYTLFTDTSTSRPGLLLHTLFNGQKYTRAIYPILSTYNPATDRGMFKTENFDYFKNVPSYRDFLFDYLRFSPMKIMAWVSIPQNTSTNFTQEKYSMGALLGSEIIRDWYRLGVIEEGFSAHHFNDVLPTYESFIYDDYKTPYFKAMAEHYFASVNKLAPGKEAPDFSLKDENGQNISLKDFRGKVVYLDFWGIGCGPCIYDIQNYQAKLHEKYAKKDIVFLNICVDANNIDEWKDGLKKYNVKGINLWAKGLTDNSVCQSYNIDGIPHYYIIGKTGRIIENNAKRMGELFQTNPTPNELDEALSIKYQ